MAKTKVMITIDEDLLTQVDDYCDKNFMNRSFVTCQALMQVINQQKLIDSIQDISIAVKKCAEVGTVDAETKAQILGFESLCKMFVK